MKKISTYTLFAFGLFACTSEDSERAVNLTYPETKKIEVFDEYFGNTIVDPYRWLEDDRSDETGEWVDAQNSVTFEYLAGLKTVGDFQARLTRLMDYPKESAPFREGGYEYFYRNSGLQNQSLIYRRDDQGVEELFLDPNKLSSDGTTSVAALSFSHSGSLAAYQISEGGADWRSVAVMDAKTLKVIDRIDDVKFSGLSWLGDEGFYYSRYDQPKGNEQRLRRTSISYTFTRLARNKKQTHLYLVVIRTTNFVTCRVKLLRINNTSSYQGRTPPPAIDSISRN